MINSEFIGGNGANKNEQLRQRLEHSNSVKIFQLKGGWKLSLLLDAIKFS